MRWLSQVVIVCAAIFLATFAFSMYSPFIVLYLLHDLGAASADEAAFIAALAFSAAGVGVVILAPIWGALADRFGRKLLLMRALVGGALVVGLMGVARSGPELVVLRFFQGSLAGVSSAGPAMVASLAPAARAATALGMLQTTQYLASAISPLVGGFVSQGWGYRQSYFFGAALLLLSVVVVGLFVSEARDFTRRGLRGSRSPLALFKDVSLVVRSRDMLIAVGVLLFLFLFPNAINPVLPLYVRDLFGSAMVAEHSGEVFGSTALFAAIGALAAGAMSDKIGHRRMLVVGAVGSGLAYVLQPVAGGIGFTPFLLTRAFLGIFQGAMLPTSNALVIRAAGRAQQGAAFGFTASVSFVGAAVGPLVGALVSARMGIPALLTLTGTGFMALAFVIWVLLDDRPRSA